MKSWKAKFFTIWTGQAFSLFGSSLVDFALIWWLTETTGSQRVLTISSLLTLLPRMFLGPFAGTLIDRVNRKRVMILADGAIAFLTLGLLFAYHRNAMTVFLVMGALLLRSLGSMFHQPAMKSATALLVPASQLARIGGLNRILSGAMNIVAPVAGAMVIELFDIGAVLCIDVVTAAVAVATLAAASVPDASEGGEQKKHTLFKETADGVRYVWNTKSELFCGWNLHAGEFLHRPGRISEILDDYYGFSRRSPGAFMGYGSYRAWNDCRRRGHGNMGRL